MPPAAERESSYFRRRLPKPVSIAQPAISALKIATPHCESVGTGIDAAGGGGGGGSANVTVLSVDVDATLGTLDALTAAPAGIVTMTVPEVVIPETLIV